MTPDESPAGHPAQGGTTATEIPGAFIDLQDVTVDFAIHNADTKSLRANLIYLGSGGLLKRDAGNRMSVRALNNVTLQARDGDRIGLIGRNGAGKTTLLRLLAGIYPPTFGRATVQGRVAAILGGAVGVDPEVTGYEAIEYGCILLGIQKAEIKRLKPEIAEFTELGDYLAMPVRTYSSGMTVRLSFAIATSVRPDILLIDEVIGAGDAHFVEKAKQRAVDFMGGSRILVLASHTEEIIRDVCNKVILLDKGEVLIAGDVAEVVSLYHGEISRMSGTTMSVQARTTTEDEKGKARDKPGGAICDSARRSHPAAHAFQEGIEGHWLSERSGEAVNAAAYIGHDFGPDETIEVRQIILRQWNGAGASNTVSSVLVQSSNDNFQRDITTVCETEIAPDIARQRCEVPASRPARYWRLVANSPTGGGPWGVAELNFYGRSASSENGGTDEHGPDEQIVSEARASSVGVTEVCPIEVAVAHGEAICDSSSGPHGAELVYDGSLATMWVSDRPAAEIQDTAYIGYDFGPGNAVGIQRLAIRQWDGEAQPNFVSSVKLQCSDDNFVEDIRTVAIVPLAEDSHRHLHHCATSEKARWWRVLADSPTGGGHWGLVELEFSDQAEPETIPSTGPSAGTEVVPGNAISNGDLPPYPSKNAFNGRVDSRWISAHAGLGLAGKAFIGYDFGPDQEVEVRRIVIQQWNSGLPPNMIDAVIVECSSDNFETDIKTVADLAIARNSMRNAYDLAPSRQARYWRLVADSTTGPGGGHWGLVNLEFWDESGRRAGG